LRRITSRADRSALRGTHLMRLRCFSWLTAILGLAINLAAAAEKQSGTSETANLDQMAARLVPTDITVDLSKLTGPRDREVLAKLVEASKIIDGIFLRQVWNANASMLLDLAKDQTPEGHARLHYFLINKGPWSRLDEDKPFIAGVPPKPLNA